MHRFIATRFSAVVLTVAVFLGLTGAARGDDSAQIEALNKRVAELEKKAESGFTTGIGKRPYIGSKDGKFKVEFGGRLQARYTYQARDVRGDDRDASDRSWGELERARVRMQGTLLDPRFFFRAEWDGHSDGGSLGLTDGFIQYVCTSKETDYQMKIGLGQWKPYFGRQEKQSSAQQLLVDRSLANEFFSIDRNIGTWVEGRKGRLGWEVAVTNGFDSANRDIGDGEFDQIPAFVAHLDLDVIGHMTKEKYALSGGDYKRREKPGLTMGTSFASDSNNGSGGSDSDFVEYDVYQMAYDAVFKWQGFSLNAEYFGRWLDFEAADVNAEGGDDGSALYSHGAYVESGYMVTAKLQIVGRGSSVWNRQGPTTSNAYEAGGGLNYFFNHHNLKLSLDVLYLDVPKDMMTMTEKLPGLGGSKDDFDSSTAPVRNDFSHASFSSNSTNLSEFQGVMLRTQLQIYF